MGSILSKTSQCLKMNPGHSSNQIRPPWLKIGQYPTSLSTTLPRRRSRPRSSSDETQRALIAPLFNKFTPMPDGALKSRVEALLAKCGFASKGLYVMDASRRSTPRQCLFHRLRKGQAHCLLRHAFAKPYAG